MLKDKKGFTLIELVIVIVIIAILAAVLVPSITAWVDKSKIATLKGEADSVKTAVMGQLVETYGKDKSLAGVSYTAFADNTEFWQAASDNANTTLQAQSGSEPKNNGDVTFSVDPNGITHFTYYSKGHIATYNGTTWEYE